MQVKCGPEGVEPTLGLGSLSAYEAAALEALLPRLKADMERGLAFAAKSQYQPA